MQSIIYRKSFRNDIIYSGNLVGMISTDFEPEAKVGEARDCSLKQILAAVVAFSFLFLRTLHFKKLLCWGVICVLLIGNLRCAVIVFYL